MINGMEHVGLCANDPVKLVEWYVEALGFRVARVLEAARTYFVRAPDGSMLEIYPARVVQEPVDNIHSGLRHLALSVNGIEGEIARLRRIGIEVPDETIVVTPQMTLAFFRDPEGNLLHLVERTTPIP